MSRKYCYIYSKIVEGDGDMVGHIAYSIYKGEKVAHIEDYKKEHHVDIVPDKVINKFIEGRESQKSIQHYRDLAEGLLQDFIGGSFDDMSEEVIKKVADKLTSHIDEKVVPQISPKKKSFFAELGMGVLESMLGTVALAIIIWFCVNVVSKYDLKNFRLVYIEESKKEMVKMPEVEDSITISNEFKKQAE